MRRFMLAIAATASILGSSKAIAQDDFEQRFFARVGDWTVRKLKTAHSGCHTYRETAAGDLYGMTYGVNRPVMLSFALASVRTQGESKSEFEVRFVPPAGGREQSWGRHGFTTVEMQTGGTIYLSELLAANFLDAFAANGALRIYAGDRLFTTLSLDGAGPAIAKLRECAASVATAP